MGSVRWFFAEVRRRNVLRAALLYVGAIWALAQGIAQLTPEFDWPVWSTRAFVLAATIGFPFWIVFAWFYELTPQGFRRERDVPEGESITRQTGRKLDYWIIGVLSMAVILLLTERLLSRRDTPAIDQRSIAILPLVNASGDADDDYFSDGLTEELIASLTRIGALRVIGRSSAFEFKDSHAPRSEIAASLGVAHLLEGTVRRHDGRIRILVELIHAADGVSLWSQTYNRELQDIFSVQGEIARAVAAALQVELVGTTTTLDPDQPPSGNAEAYQAYLQGRAFGRRNDQAGRQAAIRLHREALRLDPEYVAAYMGLTIALINYSAEAKPDQVMALEQQAREAAARAMALAPDNPNALLANAFVEFAVDADIDGAVAATRRILEQVPNSSDGLGMMAALLVSQGRHVEALDYFRRALSVDPLRLRWRLNILNALIALQRLDEADREIAQILTMVPDPALVRPAMLEIAALRGDAAAIARMAEEETDPDSRRYALALATVVAGAAPDVGAAIDDFVAGCADPVDCAYNAALLSGLARQPERLFDYLAQAARVHGYQPNIGHAFLAPYLHDPRYRAHLAQFGRNLP